MKSKDSSLFCAAVMIRVATSNLSYTDCCIAQISDVFPRTSRVLTIGKGLSGFSCAIIISAIPPNPKFAAM